MSDSYEPLEDQQNDETPVDPAEGEPLDGDCVLEFTGDDKTVVVDGVTMSLSCTLKTLRAGCSALGLSGRGGKVKCLKRMVEHVRAQALLAAHGAQMRLRGETERIPVAQTRPEEPTQREIENHFSHMSLTELGALSACSIVQSKTLIQDKLMKVQGIQFFRWNLGIAADQMTRLTSLTWGYAHASPQNCLF